MGSDGSSGGETSFVEAGFRCTAPAAFRYSKKERTTESLSVEVTLSEMSAEAGGFLLPEDAPRVRARATALAAGL